MSRRSADETPLSGNKTPLSGMSTARKHTDDLLDQALADSFPASDPVSTLSTDAPPAADAETHLPLSDETLGKGGKE